jgi:hypothetical protein
MRIPILLLCSLVLPLSAREPVRRFIVDDDEYLDKVAENSGRLLQAGKLKTVGWFRSHLQTRGMKLKLAEPSHQKLTGPDLCDRLRESTFAVGAFYKCPDCGQWHFNSGAGFAVGEAGIVSTCCHVLLGEEEDVRESYLVAADSAGRVYPVQSVLAADKDSDTCLLQIEAHGLRPLPLLAGARAGERVYCLSHPGGYHYMFTEGIVARLSRVRNDVMDENGKTNGLMTRPILFLNVTAEFAPGSSGAPLVDEAGNVLGQVASIADAGEPPPVETNAAIASPSVPIRFCTAAEELFKLIDPALKESPKHPPAKPKLEHLPRK